MSLVLQRYGRPEADMDDSDAGEYAYALHYDPDSCILSLFVILVYLYFSGPVKTRQLITNINIDVYTPH